ncbi:MAG: UDP-galactopyranose mutase, partial [Gemmatimonadota bacterium]|nr:UDP-galactopyranose mutase [Gemmatimonadota bacterium]
QCMPLHGYTRMFENMVDHAGISLALGVDFADLKHERLASRIIYSGPVDEYFGYRYGKLPYRSLRFEHVTVQQAQFQPVAVVNFPAEDVAYTRITEYKHLTGQQHASTSLTYEYPCDTGDPYYPVPNAANHKMYSQYQALAEHSPGVTFVGRLGTYRYYNMDQVVGQALTAYTRLTSDAPHLQSVGEAQLASA